MARSPSDKFFYAFVLPVAVSANVVLGVLILGVLNNGVNTYNVPVEAQHILIGVIIVANTALSQWNSRSER